MTFLNLGEVCVHRSILEAKQFAGMTIEERTHATRGTVILRIKQFSISSVPRTFWNSVGLRVPNKGAH
jgi:hypothetical protein